MVLSVRQSRSNYRILGPVGHGQFGRVYCAIHRKTGRLVAIKLLNRYRLPTHTFLKEVNCLLSLDHPNIVACHALEHVPEGRQLILEYCEGGTLRSLMESASRLCYPEILSLATDIVAGLAHAHQQGIVHCDIKPENILLQYQGGRWTAKISDFGIAKVAQDLTASSSGQTGSPAYMAPERFYKQYSTASDVYAVGILLFELLTGNRPFSGTPDNLMDAHLNNPVPVTEALFDPLKTVVLKALEKIPARRYTDARAMLSALQPLAPNLDKAILITPEATSASDPGETHQPFVGQPIGQFEKPIEYLLTDSTDSQTVPSHTHTEAQRWVIGISKQYIHLQDYRLTQGESHLNESTLTSTPNSILDIRTIPQGFCMVTSKALYGMNSLFHADNFKLHSIHHWPDQTHIVVAPNGRWFAGLSSQTLKQSTQWQLTVGALRYEKKWPAPQKPLWINQSLELPSTVTVQQVLSTDNRHILLVLNTPKQGTQLQVIARRGLKIGQINLRLSLYQLTPTPDPYRFLALDADRPQSAIILDIKPIRLRRLQLEIAPRFLTTMAWGYLFLDTLGRLLLLDRDTVPIGCIEGPANPVAMYPASNHEILIATWDNNHQQSHLYSINLQDFDLDILF